MLLRRGAQDVWRGSPAGLVHNMGDVEKDWLRAQSLEQAHEAKLARFCRTLQSKPAKLENAIVFLVVTKREGKHADETAVPIWPHS